MHRQICQLPMMRRLRAVHYRSLTFAVLASLGACDGDSPVAPTDVPPAPAEEQALVTTAQRILFASYRNGAYDIYRTDPQGSSVVRVTSFSGDESRPAWSPDYKRIAMVRSRMGSDSLKRSDIYLMNADGTGKRWARSLPSSFGMGYPSWSPDGSRLVVVVALGGKLYLATMDVATGNMAFVTCENELVQGSSPSWSPTGNSIVYVAPDFASIRRCNPGGDVDLLVSSGPSRIGKVTYSPDGKRIAYSEGIGINYNSEIFVKNLTDGSVKRLTNSAGYEGHPTWSPDGTRIAFVAKRSGQFQLWTMNSSTGGGLTRVTNASTDEIEPAWSH